FTNTKLNAAIQQAVDDQGNVNWSVMPDCLKTDSEITGLDRQNAADDTSEWLELMISKKKCSVDEANAILNLLLIGVVNESTGEIGTINMYDDNSERIAVLMNLAKDVLKIVPMKDMGWRNDGQGNRPKEFDEWVRELAEAFLELITALIAAIGDFIAGLIKAVVEAGLKFVQAIVAAVMALIEAIVKASIIAFIYLDFAIVLSSFISMFTLIVPIFILLGTFLGAIITTKKNILEIERNNTYSNIGFYTGMEYNDFFELEIPTLYFFIEVNDLQYITLTNFFSLGPALEIGFFDNLFANPHFLASDPIQISNSNSNNDEFWNGFEIILGLFSVFETSGMLNIISSENRNIKLAVRIASILGFFTLLLSGIQFILNFKEKEKIENTFRGMLAALAILFIVHFSIWRLSKTSGGGGIKQKVEKFIAIAAIFSVIAAVLSILGFFIDLNAAPISGLLALGSMIFTILALANLPKAEDRKDIAREWFGLSVILFVGFFVALAIYSARG
ncbi:MAG: hypothetical protein ACTSRA_21905, partial [Promethearchaeota archaeon]